MVGTISDVYLDLRNELRHHGVTSAPLEAKELLAFALEIPRAEFNERSGSYLFDEQLKRLEELKSRRLKGEPLAHIIGEWDFYSLTFILTPGVLMPAWPFSAAGNGDGFWICAVAAAAWEPLC